MARGRKSKPGDTRWSPNGYHYTRTKTKWELTHKLIAEETLGRPLRDNERIRYKDGDRRNLSPENIAVYTVKERSGEAKLAALKAKRDDLDAQIRELENELALAE